MMKKKLAAFLVAGMVCAAPLTVGATASTQITQDTPTIESTGSRDGTVDLTYTVPEAYTVTIPDAVQFTGASSDAENTINTAVKATGVVLKHGQRLEVTVSGKHYSSGWNLDDGNGNKLSYTFQKAEGVSPATDVTPSEALLSVSAGSEAEKTVNLSFKIPSDAKIAGEYTDTLTFHVKVANASAQK